MANESEFERQLAALKELVMSRFTWEEKARGTAYLELERRLTDLNHAHENMVKDRTEFVRLEAHNRFYQEYREWSQRVDASLAGKVTNTEFDPWKEYVNNTLSTQKGRSAVYAGLVGVGLVAINILLHYWR